MSDDVKEVGRMTATDAIVKLRAINDEEAVKALEEYENLHGETKTYTPSPPQREFDSSIRDLLFRMPTWRAATHLVGFIATSTNTVLDVVGAETIEPDINLIGKSATIRLLRLGIFDYPGGRGQHDVLVEFGVRDAKSPATERIHFSQAYHATQPGYAINGFPIFKGVQIDQDGLSMTCRMVNVRNKADQGFLDVLSSPVFQQGLDLAGTFQPAMKPLTEMALGLTSAFAKRNENALVQNVHVQLAFSANAYAPRLREGTYVFVQIPEAQVGLFDWSEWAYHPTMNAIARKNDKSAPLMNNHFVLGVSF